jgi:hypothetical protein
MDDIKIAQALEELERPVRFATRRLVACFGSRVRARVPDLGLGPCGPGACGVHKFDRTRRRATKVAASHAQLWSAS